MEELYILSDGSQVDVSKFSEFERTRFFVKNPGAKKQKGTAKSAGAVPKKNQALNKNTVSNSGNGSLGSQKFRLADEQDLEIAQKKGIMPPPSTQPRVAVDDYNALYNYRPGKPAKTFETKAIKLPGQRTAQKLKVIESDADMEDYVKNFRDNAETGELGYYNSYKIQKVKRKIQETDSELKHPYLYYSKANPEVEQDDFVESNYNAKELETLGINPQDFDGYLNKKGYKQDYLSKKQQGLFDGVGDDLGTGYEIKLAEELARKKMLTFYMEEMQRRDFTKQDLNQEIEVILGKRKDKEIQKTKLFDQNGLTNYVEKNFPIITQKLKERDVENAKLYKEAKSGGTDFFSWDTASKIGKAGWNAVVDRTNQFTATAFDVVGMDETAEGIRLMGEENEFLKPDDRGVAYVSGKKINYNGTKYIVDSRGEIYDADAKIRVTDLFDEKTHQKLIEDSKYEPSDYMFSTQGAAVQTSGVVADMLLQAALTKGVGTFGSIASETRMALVGAQKASKFTSLLNDTSQLLRSIPLERGVGYSLIAQSTLGYTQGYEDTLKAARDNGINDEEAIRLATNAGTMMAALYAATGNINPQTKLVENLFSPKRVIKEAMEQYLKVGEKGFVNYLRKTVANVPKNLIEFVEEGGKEVIQENIQQAGEIGVNMITNKDAGKKIVNDVMTGDDFVNTSILSFVSSGLMSKMKMPDFNKRTEAEDDLMSLSTLAKNKKEFDKTAKNLVDNKVFTQEQVDKLKQDVDVYYNNINKLPKTTSAEVAMPIMRELDKVQKLVDKKQSVDKAFHEDIDDEIDDIRENVRKITYSDQLRIKNKAASDAIKKGVIKNTKMMTFANKQEMVTYLRDNMNMTLEKAESIASQPGFMLNATNLRYYLKDPSNVKDDQKMIFVNEGAAIRQGNTVVGQHEFLHGLIAETIKGDTEAQQLLGKALADELMKMQKIVEAKGTGETALPSQFIQRFGNYVQKYQGQIDEAKQAMNAGEITKAEYDSKVRVYLGNQWEEALTLYSDAISNGSVKYDEGTFTRLKDTIRQVLQFLGIKNIEFNSGKDVYNFLKDYNKSMETGYFGVAMKKVGTKGAVVNKEALRKELGKNKQTSQQQKANTTTAGAGEVKLSLGDNKNKNKDKKRTPEQIKQDVNNYYNRDTFTKDVNKQYGNFLQDLMAEYDFILLEKSRKYQKLPGFSMLDFEAEVKGALMPHIRNFNKEFLEKREEYKQELIKKGEDPNSQKFKDKIAAKDKEGYEGKKGIIKENDSLNGWINSQLENKIYIALKTGNVADKKYLANIDDERFKETGIIGDFGGEQGEELDWFGENDEIFDAQQDFEVEQNKLAVLLRDPVFRFTDEDGNPVNIEVVPRGATFITEINNPDIPANIRLKSETDPAKREEILKELSDLKRGLELQEKTELTEEEKKELQDLKSFDSFDLSTRNVEKTFKALSMQDSPARIVSEEVGIEILRSPNVETLEYRNFKENLSDMSKTMMKRVTFERGENLKKLMYDEWDLIYKVINHPVDPVTGESSFSSKKIPPRLKEFDDNGDLRKIGGITRVKFLQSFFGIEDATSIIKKYGGKDANAQLQEFEPEELNEKTGKKLVPQAYFDRRTALRELFGDVMVLQEARRLLRSDSFLEKVKERNVNLYNQLKDDIVRAAVLKDMSKGKSEEVKFTLIESMESKQFLSNFKELTSSQAYKDFTSKIKDIYHSGSEVENYWNEHETKIVWFTTGQPERDYGDGIVYRTKLSDVPGTIIIPDSNRSDQQWSKRFLEKFPDVSEELIKDIYKNEPKSRIKYIQDENGNQVYEGGVVLDFSKYAEERLPENLKQFSDLDVDSFIEKGIEIGYNDKFREIVEYFFKYKYSLRPLEKEMSFQEFKEENELNPRSPSVFWLLEPKNIKYADKVFLEFVKFYQEDPSKAVPMSEGSYDKEDGSFGDFNEMILIGPMDNYKIEKEDKNGNFGEIKFSLLDDIDEMLFKRKFKTLLKTKEYVKFRETLKKNTLGHDGSFVVKKAVYSNKRSMLWWYVDGTRNQIPIAEQEEGMTYGDGVHFTVKVEDLKDFVILPDIDDHILFHKYIENKYPKLVKNLENLAEKKNEGKNYAPDRAYDALTAKNVIESKYADFIFTEFIKFCDKYGYDTGYEIKNGKPVMPRALTRSMYVNGKVKSGIQVITLGKLKRDQVQVYSEQENAYEDVKFSLLDKVEDAIYKRKFKKLLNSKEYTTFYNNLKGQELYHSGSKSIEGTIAKDKVRAMWFYVGWDTMSEDQYIPNENGGFDFEPFYGDGVIYKTKPENIPGAIIIPDIDFAGNKFKAMIARKYPKAIDQMINNISEKEKTFWEKMFNQANYYPFEIRDVLATNYANEIIIDFIKELSSPQFTEDSSFLVSLEKGEDYSGLPVVAFGKMKTQNLIQKENKTGGYDDIKFSLAEQENAKYSLFMNGLPLSQQWIVARDIDNAIMAAKTATSAETDVIDKLNKKIAKETDPLELKKLKEKLEEVKKTGNITFKVPSKSKETDKAIAYFIISKVAEGYNDFEFTIKKNADGPLTRQVLEALDFKSKTVQERMEANGNLERTMNEIIEENKGVEVDRVFSPETAKNLGKNIGRFDLYLPPEDEDFLGLMYTLASGKGQKGEKQTEFFVENLLKPYSDAMLNLMKARQTMYNDWKNLINKKHKGITKILKKDSGYGGYLYDQAVRVYLWKKAGYEIPGLDRQDVFSLVDIVRTNPELRAFAEDVSLMSKQANGYIEPGHNWGFGSVVGDMNNIISKSNRTKYLEHWQSNVDKIFSKDNLAKIEAVYGRRYVKALKNMLERMQTGSNRLEGSSDAFLNFTNGATAITMFWNIRSAALQVLGAINYVNTSDNNILEIGKTLLNPKQWVRDFFTVWNSDYSRDRRSGLMNDIAEAELAQLMNDSRNTSVLDKVTAFKYWLLKNGFGATRVMDSFAIALGGSSFYRNRLNTYLKQGYSEEDAKKATWRDFYNVSEQSQQSADVSKISMNQASTKGRLLLTFMNTPFQYSRLIKRSLIDLVKGRGSVPNNIAKIVYYSTLQNAMFNFLQNALFAKIFGDDDDEEKITQGEMRMWNGMLDTLIRGTGLGGVVLSAVKNTILKWYEKHGDPKGYGDVLLELSNLSPSISIKLRQLAKAYKAYEYNAEEIEFEGFSINNVHAIEALTSVVSMTTNIPLDRLYQKSLNVKAALNSDYATYQRIALLLGWSEWNLGLIDTGDSGSNTSDIEGMEMPEMEGMEGMEMPEME